MDGLARHLAAAALIISIASSGACGDPEGEDACAEYADGFALLEPDGAAELIPGSGLRLAWPAPPAGVTATVTIALVEGELRMAAPRVDAAAGEVTITAAALTPPPQPGSYRIEAAVGTCAGDVVLDGGPSRLVYVQGLTFAPAPLAITADDTPFAIDFRTVSLSSFALELLVDPTPDTPAGDDALAFAAATVPGELVPMNRALDFTGDTTGGDPIPDGTYRVVARVTPSAPAMPYDVAGPMLSWTR